MLMQECECQWKNEPGGVPIRIKHLLHLSAVRYGEIFHEPNIYQANISASAPAAGVALHGEPL